MLTLTPTVVSLIVLWGTWFHCISGVLAAKADDWRTRSVYQVVTDRFAPPSNVSTLPPCNTDDRKYCGGTFLGLRDHLDYIQTLGFDAVSISPPFTSVQGKTLYGEGYLGEWPQDLTSIESHFGTDNDLIALSKALHDRGMYLLLDIVINHLVPPTPFNVTSFTKSNGTTQLLHNTIAAKPFSDPEQFHDLCFIGNVTSNQTTIENCWLGDASLPYADLNTENSEVVHVLNDWIAGVVAKYSVDGLKLSMAKNIPIDFWKAFTNIAGVFALGEVVTGDPNYTKNYTEGMDAVMDYPVWFTVVDAFRSPQGNLSALYDVVAQSQKLYSKSGFVAGSFTENRHEARFPSRTQDLSLVLNALTWPFIHDGIPIIYYGQEQGFAGGGPPGNHEPFWLSGNNTANPFYRLVRSMNAARHAAMKSTTSYFLTTPMKFVETHTNSTLAVSKPPLLSLLTNAGSGDSTHPGGASWNVTTPLYKAGQELIEVFSCRIVQANDGGGVNLTSLGGMPQVLLPATILRAHKDAGICRETTEHSGAPSVRFGVGGMRLVWGAVVLLVAVVSFV
ncbi:glycoside hydrolase family 13 protein [Coniophora puteana RWD-64-598 SS2]|uniref:alpha-amylase n=1 Tax=Coniophora puteana (strain RWD-64-598) TaxID=741705 RepID=A0A5M3N517_CONPW|nr:glycoside hydrolase family 13 protein [Coniophora puteana RWD-64-598 SS2]EIW86154.1 glycoside hydrolase family 13 protein [Coniophora puteana RWD-64-598 SS2]